MTQRPGTIVFHRPARVHSEPVERGVASIATPPPVPEPVGNTVWQILAPVLGSTGMVGFALILGEPRFMIMAGMIAGVMLVSGLISRVIQVRTDRRRNRRVAERYRSHLTEVQARVDRAASIQRTTVERSHPAPSDLVALVRNGTRIWERRSHHTDFLTVRIGTGTVASATIPQLEVSSDPMTELEPELLSEANALVAATSELHGLPIIVDLQGLGCLAVVGDRPAGRRVARSLISQLASFCAPTDLGVMAHIESAALADWEWAKWLPHVRAAQTGDGDDQTLLCVDATDFDIFLEQIATPRIDAQEQRRGSYSNEQLSFRQIVVLVDGYAPGTDVWRSERFESALIHARDIGLLVITLVDHPDDVPSHAGATITLGLDGSLGYAETSHDGLRVFASSADHIDAAQCEAIARCMAPMRVRSSSTTATLDSAGLLDLLGEYPATFDAKRSWASPGEPLSSPIGLGPDGEPLSLDIREASVGGMGPHGILIGATGSGKSELLRTLVLGMAARNDPDELTFVLADFKGGSTFVGLERLPHTAGMICNLEADPTLIDRMQDALFGEMERRQRVLRAAGFDRADKYREHRLRSDESLEPLPALLVVVDEFGELLATRPEFVDLFTSIGRTGRSLGVHLLLSSQRLDEGRIRKVESHLRYRICLRTFSPEESTAVIGSRASFDLPPIPGIGHLSVDSNLTQFKAGLVNRPIRSTDELSPSASGEVRKFELSGPTSLVGLAQAPSHVRGESSTTEMNLLLARIAVPGRAAQPVWVEPLPARLEGRDLQSHIDTPRDHDRDSIIVGLTDLPRQQRQIPAELDFTGTGGNLAIVGGPRSGKSTTLATIATALAATRRPDEAGLYVIDLGGGTMHYLDELPHVGSVFGRSHRQEVPRLIRQLHATMTSRVDEFREHRLTSIRGYLDAKRDGRIDTELGEVYLLIDNWGLFTQEFGMALSDLVAEIVSGGLHYGVHVILTAGRWQDIRMSLRDNIGGRLELHLSDPIESEIDRHAARQIPADVPGRAIDSEGRLTQIALADPDLSHLISRWHAHRGAPPIRMLPSIVTEDDLNVAPGTAVGIEEHALSAWAPDLFGANPHFLVFGDGGSGKTGLLRGIVRHVRAVSVRGSVRFAIIDYRRQLNGEALADDTFGVAFGPEDAIRLIDAVVSELSTRTLTADAPTAGRPEIVVVVDDYDLVAGASGNPLGALVDLVARGKDVGLHLVLARTVAGLSRSSFEPILQRVREIGTPTLVMDGDGVEGPVAGGVKAEKQPVGRGILVERSRKTLVQVARFESRASLHRIQSERIA